MACNLTIWPVPCKNVLHMEGLDTNTHYDLIDPLGRPWNKEVEMEPNKLLVHNLPNGIYYLLFRNENNSGSIKFEVIHE